MLGGGRRDTGGGSGTPHGEELTRSQLLSRRNTSQLELGKTYIITDYNRANVGQANIALIAIGANVLARHGIAFTSHDNLGWDCEYDIDTNRIVALHDNRGNRVSGSSGNEVDRFDWGNTRFTECTIENAQLYSAIGQNTITVTRLKVVNYGYADIRNAQGTLQSTSVSDYGRLNLNGTTGVNIAYSTVENYSYLLFNSQQNVIIQYSHFRSNTDFRYSGGSRVRVEQSEFYSYAEVRISNGDVRFYRSSVGNLGRYNQNSNATANIYYTHIDQGYFLVRNMTGIIQTQYVNLDSYGQIYLNGGAGRADFAYVNVSSNGYLYRVNSTDNSYFRQLELTSRAEIQINACTGNNYFSYCNLNSYGRAIFVRCQNFRNEQTHIAGRGEMLMYDCSSTATKYIRYSAITGGGQIDVRNAQNYNFGRVQITSYGRLYMRVSGAYPRLNQSTIHSAARFEPEGSTHYYLTMQSGCRILAKSFQTRYLYASGQFTQTLTANNTNRYRGYGQNTLI